MKRRSESGPGVLARFSFCSSHEVIFALSDGAAYNLGQWDFGHLLGGNLWKQS
jgi:hypothetical protein